MSEWISIVDKAFVGNKRIQTGRPHVIKGDGAPSGITAPVGILYWDYTNSNAYICTVANTTWVKINA